MSFSSLYTTPTGADRDLSTLSNYLEIRTTHIDLEWSIDWKAKTFGGSAILSLEATKDVGEVVLDTSYLAVEGVEVDGSKAEWKLDDRIDVMGQALRVKLPNKLKKGEVSYLPFVPPDTRAPRSRSPMRPPRTARPSGGSTPSRPRAASTRTSTRRRRRSTAAPCSRARTRRPSRRRTRRA
jgi:hypothetical protein